MSKDIQNRLEVIFRAIFSEIELDFSKEISPRVISQWDSLNYLSLVLSIEEEFGIIFSDDDLMKLNSFTQIVEQVERLSK